MAEKTYKGKTEDAAAPFLSAEFWKKGTKVVGTIDRRFKAGDQVCYVLQLVTPVTLNGETVDVVSVGSMAGLGMALQAAHLKEFVVADKVVIECTGQTAPKKAGNSPRVDFSIEVTRDEEWERDEVFP